MATPLLVALGASGVVLVWLATSYNRFQRQLQVVASSWSTVDTELRRRHDLIPNLVATVSGYARHEAEVLERVVEARQRAVTFHGGAASQAGQEGELSRALGRLMALSEAYPELRASGPFLALQEELVVTEDRIQATRRFYNANVRELNERVQQVPSNLVARAFGIRAAAYFEVEPALRSAPPPRAGFDGAPAA